MSFIKEDKVILPSITKFATKHEVLAEALGYRHASEVGLRTAKLLHWSENAISVEYIAGISCFRYLHLLNETSEQDKKKFILKSLVDDVLKFQSATIINDISFSPYPIKEKTEEILDVMNKTGHPRANLLSKKLSTIQQVYLNYATIPFRDANPKNTLLSNVTEDNFSSLSISEIVGAIRHIDFRSISELTTRYDDIISTLYHYQIPEKIRSDLLNYYNINNGSEEFIVTLFVRIGRFWSRRNYYMLERNELFNIRYKFEKLEFYNYQFSKIVELIINVY